MLQEYSALKAVKPVKKGSVAALCVKWNVGANYFLQLKKSNSIIRKKRDVKPWKLTPSKVAALEELMGEHKYDDTYVEIVIWRVSEPYTAKKKSKNYEKGEVYDKDCNMDAAFYPKMMLQKVYPAIRQKMAFADIATVQQDNASPHTCQNSIAILNRSGNYSRILDVKIQIEKQESNSPDTNGNDLAFFPSCASMVSKRKTRTLDMLVDEVTTCYDEYPSHKLARVFSYKNVVLNEIIKYKGNNTFKLPHRRS